MIKRAGLITSRQYRLRTEKAGHTKNSNAKTTPFKRPLFNVEGHASYDVSNTMSASSLVHGFPDAENGTKKSLFTMRHTRHMTLKEGASKSWTALCNKKLFLRNLLSYSVPIFGSVGERPSLLVTSGLFTCLYHQLASCCSEFMLGGASLCSLSLPGLGAASR